ASQRTYKTNATGAYIAYGYDNLGQLTSAFGYESNDTARIHEKLLYQYDPAGNLITRTNNGLVQTFQVDDANQLMSVSRSGSLTVAGTTTGPATNVTVNGSGAAIYPSDNTFAADGFVIVNGTNAFTASAQDTNGRNSSDV